MNVPGNWTIRPLRELQSLFHNGVWGDDPSQNEKAYLVIRSTEIDSDGRIDPTTGAYRVIPESKVIKYALEQGDILLVGSSGSQELIGRAAFWDLPSNQPVLFSNFMICLRPKGVVPKYLFYSLKSYRYSNFLKRLQQTSTGLRNLPKDEFLKFQIPCPPVPEQKKIVEILSTVDERTKKSREQVSCLEKTKSKFISQIFSSGNVRETIKLKDLVVLFHNGIWGDDPKGNTSVYPVIRSTEISPDGDINLATAVLRGIPEKRAKRYLLAQGDILFVASSGSQNLVGRAALFNYSQSASYVFSNFMVRLRVKDINPNYLFYAFKSEKYLKHLKRLQQTSTGLRNLPKDEFLRFDVPICEKSKQDQVVKTLSDIDSRLTQEKQKQAVLERIKKCLLNELLSGKKRVGALI